MTQIISRESVPAPPNLHPVPPEVVTLRDAENDHPEFELVRRAQGDLAVRTVAILDMALGKDSEVLLPSFAATRMDVFRHLLNTAMWANEVADAADLGAEQRRQLVASAFMHDIGKFDKRILPLVDYDGYFSNEQRALMRRHAYFGKAGLLDMAGRAYGANDEQRGRLYAFSAWIAGDHHRYNMERPDIWTDEATWRWAATIVTQIVDQTDAVTTPKGDRRYVAARLEAENDADPLAALDRNLTQYYGELRDSRLPIIDLTPQEIAEIALIGKRFTWPFAMQL